MFVLDSTAGNVTWGEFRLGAYLTQDKFSQKYPQIPVVEERYYTSDSTIKTYQLPSMIMGEQAIVVRPRFFGQHFEAIHIERMASANNEDQDRESERWWREELKWLLKARDLVQEQLGTPYFTEYPELLYEAEFYPKKFLDQLQNWEYRFSWGKAGIAYVSEDLVCRIWIGYAQP